MHASRLDQDTLVSVLDARHVAIKQHFLETPPWIGETG